MAKMEKWCFMSFQFKLWVTLQSRPRWKGQTIFWEWGRRDVKMDWGQNQLGAGKIHWGEYNANNDNNNPTEPCCTVKNAKNICICTDVTNMYTPFSTVAEHVWVGSLQIFHSLAYMTALCLLHWTEKKKTIRLIWLCMCHDMQKGYRVTSEH